MKNTDIEDAIAQARAEAPHFPFTTDHRDALIAYAHAMEHRITDLKALVETVCERISNVEATTRMIGEAVFPDDLADDEADVANVTIDTGVYTFNMPACKLKAKIRGVNQTMLDLADTLYADRLNPLDTKPTSDADTIKMLSEMVLEREDHARDLKAKIDEQAATIALQTSLIASLTNERDAAYSGLHAANAALERQMTLVDKLEADLEAAIIVPEGYEAIHDFHLFSHGPVGVKFVKKGGAK